MGDLLTRDEFRNAVFSRDGHKCVFCGKSEGLDAHHILERRLWPDGGYYVDNGGDPILTSGSRARGELFHDESVQKILSSTGLVRLFSPYVKYPRTWHLPWSPGATKDDRIRHDLSNLEGRDVVATVKMDGENTTIYRDHVHARSIEYRSRVDRDRMKSLHAHVAHEIPDGWRICGENLWAEHSIRYENLPSFFLVFSIWDEQNRCLSWDDTVEWSALLDLHTVPVLYRGPWDRILLERLHQPTFDKNECEGFVVRTSETFRYAEFPYKVLKYVREGHVRTQAHWTRRIVPNGTRQDDEPRADRTEP